MPNDATIVWSLRWCFAFLRLGLPATGVRPLKSVEGVSSGGAAARGSFGLNAIVGGWIPAVGFLAPAILVQPGAYDALVFGVQGGRP